MPKLLPRALSGALNKSFLALGLLLVATQVQASDAAQPASALSSQTKSLAGLSYKLSHAKQLHEGPQKLILRVTRAGKPVTGLKLTAQASMDDGMRSAVKISSRPNGELELSTKLDMSGEWQLRIQQTAPVKASVLFLLDVVGNSHHHGH